MTMRIWVPAKSFPSCSILCQPMDCSLPGSPVHEDSPGTNTGMSCHAFLQGIFPAQGLNPGLSTLQVDSLLSELPWNPGVGVPLFNQSGLKAIWAVCSFRLFIKLLGNIHLFWTKCPTVQFPGHRVNARSVL